MLNFNNRVVGYVCTKDNTEIGLLVEGGTVIFDMDSLASATSNFNFLLDLAYGEQQDVEDGKSHRYISSSSPSSSSSSSFSSTSSVSSYRTEMSYAHDIKESSVCVRHIHWRIELGQETYKHNKQTK